MGIFRPKNKFDYYFNIIGESLNLIVWGLAILFVIGFSCYQLWIGNYNWFKENPAIFLLYIVIAFIGVGLYVYRDKD